MALSPTHTWWNNKKYLFQTDITDTEWSKTSITLLASESMTELRLASLTVVFVPCNRSAWKSHPSWNPIGEHSPFSEQTNGLSLESSRIILCRTSMHVSVCCKLEICETVNCCKWGILFRQDSLGRNEGSGSGEIGIRKELYVRTLWFGWTHSWGETTDPGALHNKGFAPNFIFLILKFIKKIK